MELYQIRYFLALCETLNFTRAAENCHVTQPTLTRAIKLLEEQFGGPLFHRERNHTHPTELGRMMHPYFEQIHSKSLEAKEHAKRIQTLAEASLRVGVTSAVATSSVVDLFRRYHGKHPSVELCLTEAAGDDLRTLLVNGEVDAALYASPHPPPGEFHALPLIRERVMVGVCAGHRFEGRRSVRLSDLEGEHYLVRERGEYTSHIDQLLRASAVEVSGRYRSFRDDWICAMAAAGLGFCLVPEGAFGDGELVASGPNLTFRFACGFPGRFVCASLGNARANEYSIEGGRPSSA